MGMLLHLRMVMSLCLKELLPFSYFTSISETPYSSVTSFVQTHYTQQLFICQAKLKLYFTRLIEGGIMSIIVERIKCLCEENGLSLRKLEKHLGFSISKISKWNNTSPSVKSLTPVAEYFHVSLDYLCGISDTPFITHELENLSPELFEVIRYFAGKEYTSEQATIILNQLKILESFRRNDL